MPKKLYGRFVAGDLTDMNNPRDAVLTWVNIALLGVETEGKGVGGVDWSALRLTVGPGEPPWQDSGLIVTIETLSKGD